MSKRGHDRGDQLHEQPCTGCGSLVRANHRFCPTCGAPLTHREPPPVHSAHSAAVSLDQPEDRRLASVLVAVLPGLVALGDRLDPEVLRYFESSFIEVIDRVVRRYDGTLAKASQREAVAWFGAPVGHEDDSERAVLAGLDLINQTADLSAEVESRHQVYTRLQVGIATGEVVAGPLVEVQASFTVMGGTVDVAQALAGAAAPGQLLIGELTHRLVRHSISAESLPPLVVPGRSEPLACYGVVGRRPKPLSRAVTPFLGRESELGFLARALRHVEQQARGMCIAVIGDAGVGKSRLVREFRAQVAADTTPQVAVRCMSFESDTPYALLGNLVREAFAIEPGADEVSTRAGLEGGFATVQLPLSEPELMLLLRLLGYGDRFPYNPEARRSILVRLLRQVLRQRTANGPLLIVMEDLHCADRPSLAVIGELAQDLPGQACLLLVTARPEWRPAWPAEELDLAPLSGWAARTLASHLLSGADQSIVERILVQTGGNPFFLEEIALSVGSAGLPREPQAQPAPVPASIQEVLQAHLDRLPDAAKTVLRLAAVCGRTARASVLECLAPADSLEAALSVLERERVLVPSSSGERGYAFRHALIQEVAYNAVLKGHRRRAHAAVGGALEALYPDRLDELMGELAFQYGRSDNDQKALLWLTRAADRAAALFANEEALSLYASALERAADGDGPLAAGSILEQMADLLTLTARYDEAIQTVDAARERVGHSRPGTNARLHRKKAIPLLLQGAFDQALAELEEGLLALGGEIDIEAVRVKLKIGQLHWWRGNPARAHETVSQAMNIAESLGAEEELAEGLNRLGTLAEDSGHAREAVAYFERSRAVYVRLENLPALAGLHMNLGDTYRHLARWDDALAELAAALALHERMGNRRFVAAVHNNIAEVHRSRGELIEAIAAFERSLALLAEIGELSGVALVLTGLGAARVEAGDIERGRAHLLDAQARFAVLGNTKVLPDLYRFLASAELAAGDLEAAHQAAERSVECARAANARHQEAATQRVLAEIALARGTTGDARRLLQTSRRTLAELGDLEELQRTEAILRQLA